MTLEARQVAEDIDSIVGPRILAALAVEVSAHSSLLTWVAQASGLPIEKVRAALTRAKRNALVAETAADLGAVFVDIPDAAWAVKDDSEPESDLHCAILINGALHHLTAMRVEDGDGLEPVGPYPEDLDALSRLDPEAKFRTIDINGKAYVVYAIPGDR